MKGEINHISTVDSPVWINSMLQPEPNGDCVIMILLFDNVPSWYSWPCHDRNFYRIPFICKRRIKTRRRTAYDITSNNKYTICHSKEIFVLNQCFAIRRGLSAAPTTRKIKHAVQKYFIRLISIISWQTSTSYQLFFSNSQHGNLTNASCVTTVLAPGLANDIMRTVKPTQVACDILNSTNILYIGDGKSDTKISCQSNLIQCDDGTCISHFNLCNFNNQCYINELGKDDSYLCFPSCMPDNCLCPPNHFQCGSGGCIQMAFICDGQINCPDASDEICKSQIEERTISNFGIETLVDERYFCLEYSCSTGECIHNKYVNDLLPDCASGQAEDEYLFLSLRYDGEYFECQDPTHFPCVGGLPVCFPLNKLCLFEPDEDGYLMWCRDGSHLGQCAEINCTNSYKCPDSYCIPYHKVCDGYFHCINGEDEEGCDDYICRGLLRCGGSKVCVHPQQICDQVEDCSNGEDEKLCDMKSCPAGCTCLSYSMACHTYVPNEFPVPPSEFMKHIAVIHSYLPFPNFYNICNQRSLELLNLSSNQIVHICASMKDDCSAFGKITILDLSHNHIKNLESHCLKFLTSLKIIFLAYNPLKILQRYAISNSLISYISIQSTQVRYLRGDSLVGLGNLYSLDVTKTDFQYIDRYAEILVSHISEFRFDDPRLCCIFTCNKYCVHSLQTEKSACVTLLPNWLTAYICVGSGAMLFVLNCFAFGANQYSKGEVHFTKMISLLIFFDTILSLYLPVMGTVDLYYNSHFPLVKLQWRKGIFCLAVDMISTTVTMLSVFFSAFLIFLTSQAVNRVDFTISDLWQTIRIISAMVTATLVSFNLFLCMINYYFDEHVFNTGFMCNVMGNSPVSSWTGVVSMIILCTLMLSAAIIIMKSTFELILHTRKTARDVENISGMKSNSAQSRSDAMTFMMIFALAKTAIMVPYPLLQILDFIFAVGHDALNVYVLMAFITSECFVNPIVFVFRPLLISKRQNK